MPARSMTVAAAMSLALLTTGTASAVTVWDEAPAADGDLSGTTPHRPP